jgi:DNA-binding transcriptional ArsR family regulator
MSHSADSGREIDIRIPKAVSHPVRVKVLRILNTRIASPSEIAEEMDLPVANIAYHVRTLLQLQCIEEVYVRQVRGALEHFYRAVRRPLVTSEDAELMPRNAYQTFAVEIGNAAFTDFRATLDADGLQDRAKTHLTYTPLILDQQGWEKVYAILHDAWEQATAEETAAVERLQNGGTGGPEVRSRLTILHYRAADSAAS